MAIDNPYDQDEGFWDVPQADQAPMAGGGFGDQEWDNFLKNQGLPGIQVGSWGSATPTPGSDVANEGWFNGGSPGSMTALINSHNPTADPGKPYVNSGNTGGFIEGVGVTIGPGRSIRPADYVNMYNQAVEKYGEGAVREWESRNKWDLNRIDEAFAEGGGGEGGGGGQGGSSGGPSSGGGYPGGPESIQGFRFDPSSVGKSDAFKFRFDKAMQAIERSGAARGTLLTPQTTSALQGEASGLASQEYDAEWGRQFDTHTWNESNRFNSERTNRLDDFNIYDTNRNFDRGVFESDRGFNYGSSIDSRNFNYQRDRDNMDDQWRFIDYGYNAARR